MKATQDTDAKLVYRIQGKFLTKDGWSEDSYEALTPDEMMQALKKLPFQGLVQTTIEELTEEEAKNSLQEPVE